MKQHIIQLLIQEVVLLHLLHRQRQTDRCILELSKIYKLPKKECKQIIISWNVRYWLRLNINYYTMQTVYDIYKQKNPEIEALVKEEFDNLENIILKYKLVFKDKQTEIEDIVELEKFKISLNKKG
jgi:hypothetical protein